MFFMVIITQIWCVKRAQNLLIPYHFLCPWLKIGLKSGQIVCRVGDDSDFYVRICKIEVRKVAPLKTCQDQKNCSPLYATEE